MTPDRWRQIEDLCHATLSRAPGERDAFLAQTCAGDVDLRREVESLLAQERNAVGFLSTPAAAVAVPGGADRIRGALAGQRLGAYTVRSLLGVGGMGEVYRAHDDTLRRDVAIKVLTPEFTADPERRTRFEREARMLATLNHPHIGAIYGVEEANGVRALVLELVEGETLAEMLAKSQGSRLTSQGPGLPLHEVLRIARQIADALDAAHEKGIVHRDLKPANIKITPDGTVKVLDFGLAKPTSRDNSHDLTETREGVIFGTAAYMSPEQARGHSVDKRGDIWAFGCVLYEMLTGGLTFPGETMSDTIARILEREPDWSALPAATPDAVRRLLLRCLAKDPKQRLRDIGDVRLDIDAIDAPRERTNEGAVTPHASREIVTKWLPWVITGALAIGLALLLTLWAPWQHAAAPPSLRLRGDLGADGAIANSLATQYGDSAALSPDGTLVAFVAQKGETGNRQLFVRRLDQLQATPLSGTDDALCPFFSPDGQWIGFAVSGKLKKVAVSGGAAAPLADAEEVRGGSWGDDGMIVFSPSRQPGTRLLRVSADGGKPEPLASLAEGEVTEQWPQILPGGKAVLYTSSAVNGAYNEASLVVQMVSSGARKVVQRGGFHGRYVPSGHLIYIHDATLFAAPFDLDRLEVTGLPVPAVEGIKSNSVTGGAQIAVSGTGTALYLPGPMTGAGIPIDWMNHEGATSPLRVTPANWVNPRFAPDGGRLALEVRDGGSEADIWVYELARDTITHLTSDPAQDADPVWTPDGQRVVYASARGDRSTLNLWWQRADGTGEPQRLTESKNAQRPESWDPSGKLLAFEENHKLMILPMEGDEASGWKAGTPYPFSNSPFGETNPTFSPDGRWIAYVSGEQGNGRLDVFVRPFPGAGPRWQISPDGGLQPTWSPTRNELYYGLNGQIMVAPFTVNRGTFRAEKPRLWSAGRYETRGSGNRMFDLHPDGERFALAPATQTPIGEKLDKFVFVFNFFDELRRIAPPTRR